MNRINSQSLVNYQTTVCKRQSNPETNSHYSQWNIDFKMVQLENEKNKMIQDISTTFGELKRKINKSIDKVEKSIEGVINISYNQNIKVIQRVRQYTNLSQLEMKHYERKINKMLQSFRDKVLEINLLASALSNKAKQIIQQFKNSKALKKQFQFKEEHQIIAYSSTIKLGESAIDIIPINDRFVTLYPNYAQIQYGKSKYTLNKQIDYGIKVTLFKKSQMDQREHLVEKNKKLLLLLHDQTLSLYTDKLVLKTYKPISYNKDELIKLCQIGVHVYIVEKSRILRISLTNLNEVYEKKYTGEIITVSSGQYNGMLPMLLNDMIVFMSLPECDPIYQINLLGVRKLMSISDCLVAIGLNGVKIYRGLESYHEMYKPEIQFIEGLQITNEDILIATKDSRFIHYNLRNDEKKTEAQYWKFIIPKNNPGKMVKKVIINNDRIIALTEGGKKLHFYDY